MTMKRAMAISVVLLLAFAGCGANDERQASSNATPASDAQPVSKSASATLTPEELGELGAKIRKTPDQANQILQERGLDEKSFETQIRKVTENPDASKRYAAAYKRAS